MDRPAGVKPKDNDKGSTEGAALDRESVEGPDHKVRQNPRETGGLLFALKDLEENWFLRAYVC